MTPPPQKKKKRKGKQKKQRERGKIKNKKWLSVLLFPNEKFDLFLFALQNLKGFFSDPSFKPNVFSFPLFKPFFFHGTNPLPPVKSQLIKNERPLTDRGSYILITYYSFLQLFLDFLITGHFTKGCQLINNEEWPSQLWTLFTQLQFMQLHILHAPTAVSHSLLSREYTFVWTQNSPAPNIGGFIAQLVRASNKYHEVTGSNPVEVLNFFSGFLCNCINCVHNCKDHSSFVFHSAVLIYIYNVNLFYRNIWKHN